MCGVRLALVTMAIFLLAGTCVSQEPAFPYGACDFRSWPNLDPSATPDNCDVVCSQEQYYKEGNNSCEQCLPEHLSVYGPALLFPFGEDSCQPRAFCIENEEACYKCEPVPIGQLSASFTRCECRPGFSVERQEVDGDLFFVCKRDCEEKNGGCMQRCEDGEDDEEAECSCAEGFGEEEDGEICIDINECMTGDNKCRLPHQCVNREGSYSCRCASGFVSSEDGKQCKKANELVCMISILDITAEDKEFDDSSIDAMIREVLSQTGSWAREVDIEPTFVNGHLEFQVMMKFSPELEVEQEVRVLYTLSEHLSRYGYTTQMDGDSVYISRPVYCFSQSTGGIPLPVDAPCEWYEMAGYCLQNSRCGQDGGKPFCLCPDGWYGERCEIGEITMVDIVLIVLVAILNIKFLVLCCYVCMRWRRRSSSGKSSGSSPTKVYAKTQMTHIQQPFPAPIKYQSGALTGGMITYG